MKQKPRDRTKCRYITLSIPRDSPVEKALLADAKQLGMKQLPTLALMRLLDYYQNKSIGVPQQAPPDTLVAEATKMQDADEAWPD